MALYITDDCINCARCERECPVSAISQGVDYFEIDPDICVECEGHYSSPRCQIVCPRDCIFKLQLLDNPIELH